MTKDETLQEWTMEARAKQRAIRKRLIAKAPEMYGLLLVARCDRHQINPKAENCSDIEGRVKRAHLCERARALLREIEGER